MDFIFMILAFGSLIGVGKAIQEMKKKKQEKAELKEKLGVEYDKFIEMRNNKKKF